MLFSASSYFWKSPWSPMLEHQINSKIVHSEISDAIELLEWRASYAFSEEIKRDSLWEAAQLSFVRGTDKNRSRRLLEACLDVPNFKNKAQVSIYLGNIAFEEDPFEGLYIWKKVASEYPDHPQAAQLWVRIAGEYEMLNNTDSAIEAWEKATEYKSVRNMAHLALGRLKLKSDPPAAIEHFKIVKKDKFIERSRAAELGEQLAQWELEKN
ncbi:MAG: hypothetical protein VX278_21255 [Myxococcota bacterium]|nr:hypothetical protein [Myxococcota bacterium]